MDPSPVAPRRSYWTRSITACGCLLLVALGACALAAWKGMRYLTDRVPAAVGNVGRELERAAGTAVEITEAALRERWRDLRGALDELATDEGVRRLYRANPDLAAHFGSEEAFVARARQWRPKVQALGEDLPSWEQADATFKPFLSEGTPALEIAYTNRRGSRVRFVWHGSRLAYIEVQ